MSDFFCEIISKIKGTNPKILIVCSGLAFVFLAGFFFYTFSFKNQPKNQLLVSTRSRPSSAKNSPSAEIKAKGHRYEKQDNQKSLIFFVDVKGAVAHSQVVKVKNGDIVQSAINLAGGILSDADLNQLNLAAPIIPGQVIYVPKKGEMIPPQFVQRAENANSSLQADTSGTSSETDSKINLNQADSSQLQTINGVGIKKAEEILKYRESHGNFKSIDDLKNIAGFGEKTVEKLKDYVSVR